MRGGRMSLLWVMDGGDKGGLGMGGGRGWDGGAEVGAWCVSVGGFGGGGGIAEKARGALGEPRHKRSRPNNSPPHLPQNTPIHQTHSIPSQAKAHSDK